MDLLFLEVSQSKSHNLTVTHYQKVVFKKYPDWIVFFYYAFYVQTKLDFKSFRLLVVIIVTLISLILKVPVKVI